MSTFDLVNQLLQQEESVKLEFKEEVALEDKFSMADFLQHMMSLANSPGDSAYILIGVKDKTKDLLGLKSDHGLTDERLQQLVRRYCTPPLYFSFEIVNIDGKKLGVVTIPPSALKPHSFSEDIGGRTTLPGGKEKQWKFDREKIAIRRGSITDIATYQEIELIKEEAKRNKQVGASEDQKDKDTPKPAVVPITFLPLPRIKGFVGRKNELKKISKNFSKSPVIIIEGLPGIGKTSLAVKFIRDHVDDLKQIFWLECQENTSLDDLFLAFSDYAQRNNDAQVALAVSENRPISDRLHSLIAVLDDRASVICLDGFEKADEKSLQVFIRETLQHAQNMKTIICTRERPKSFAEIFSDLGEVPLGGLQERDAAALLKELDIPGLKSTVHKQVAKKTEGHPLAIKLFSSLVHYGLSPQELLNDAPEFGKSLEEHWLSKIFSHLTDEERELLERFSIYTEPVKREGIHSVSSGSEWGSHLQKLQDKFLVNYSQELFSTHALIRDFCYRNLARRAAVESTALLAANYYLGGQNIFGYSKEQTPEQIEAKLKAHYYLFVAGNYFEAARIVKNIQSILMGWARYSQLALLIDKTFATIDETILQENQIAEWRSIKNWSNYYRGRLLFTQGELDKSLEVFDRLLKENDPTLLADAIQMVVNVYLEKGLPREAIKTFEAYAAILWPILEKNEKTKARILDKIGTAYILNKDFDKALPLFQWNLEIQQKGIGDSFGGSISLRQLAVIQLAKGNLDVAENFVRISIDLAEKEKERGLLLVGLSSRVLGDILAKSGDLATAISSYESALNIFLKIENMLEARKTGEFLAQVYLSSDDSERMRNLVNTLHTYNITLG